MGSTVLAVGRTEWVRGGVIPRVRPPTDVTDLHKYARLPHLAPDGTLLQVVFVVAAERMPCGRCAARMPLASSWGRPRLLAEALHGKASLCLSGCGRRAGCTCRTCTPRGRQAVGTSASSASKAILAWRGAGTSARVQFEGDIGRLGRGTTLALLLKFVGPTRGLGRAPPRPGGGAEPSRGSTRGTPTCGSRWKRMLSAWLRSGGRRSTDEATFPQLTALTLYADGSLTKLMRGALEDVDTLLRMRPKRVRSRRWSAWLGEMNSINKCTQAGRA
jgi:hypothetical protein